MPTEGRRAAERAVTPRGWLSALKRMVGMPDYAAYLAHMAERHPGCAVWSERKFFDEFVNARYGNGASRCC